MHLNPAQRFQSSKKLNLARLNEKIQHAAEEVGFLEIRVCFMEWKYLNCGKAKVVVWKVYRVL